MEMTSMGAGKRYDVSLSHQLVDEKGIVITTKEESAAIETSVSKHTVVRIPADAEPGRYTLKTTAIYDTKSAKSASYIYPPSF